MKHEYLPVSLIIPTRNRANQILLLLNSLRESTSRCQIIIVDDYSLEPLPDLRSIFPDLDITQHRNTSNLGPAASRNTGIALAHHEIIAFTDDDCCVDENWLNILYSELSRSDRSVAGLGGRVVPAKSDIVSRYFDYHNILNPWSDGGRIYYLVTANCIYKKSAILAVGGFDESIKQAGGEDPGLGFKLLSNGFRLGYTPTAIVKHSFRRGLIAFYETFRKYGFGCCQQSRKHYTEQPKLGIGFAGARNTPSDTYD